MAGGIGSRFWPLSTRQFPKQFQDILGTGRTMIQQSLDRVQRVVPLENIFVITNSEYRHFVAEQLPEIPQENIVCEPLMKNTAACNLYMAEKIYAKNPKSVMVVCPADHLILKENVFIDHLNLAFERASENDELITIGIKPTRPETGYGYIQFETTDTQIGVKKVLSFTEKPETEMAKIFMESGDFLWNAGIFVWSAKSILKAFERYLPEMKNNFKECEYNTQNEVKCIMNIYPKLQKISIDNGIMEYAENVFVIPADLGWSDLGTWTSVYENSGKDAQNNVKNHKKIYDYNSNGNVFHIKNNDKVLIVDGLTDFIVVDTEKSLLICPRSKDQEIKNYVTELKTQKKGENYI